MGRRGILDLTLNERRVLLLLRAAASDLGDDHPDMSRLGKEAIALHGALAALSVALPDHDMLWVSDDELLILAWLAMLQRRGRAFPIDLPAAMLTALRGCATALAEQEIALPHRAIARFHALSVSTSTGQLMSAARFVPRRRRKQRKPDLLGRTLTMLRDRDLISSDDFVASGIPLQLVNRLCAQGLIDRVHAGWFRPGAQFFQAAAAT